MRHTIKRLALAFASAAALVTLAGCETATPYQPLNAQHASAGGYRDRQIETNRFMVEFSGNAVTSRETVERYLLFRAAELTLAQGYDWFETDARYTDRKTETFATPDPLGCTYGPGWCSGFWGPRWRYYRRGVWATWDPWMTQPLEVHEISRFTASAEVVMHKGPKPATGTRAFDARDVISHLSQSVQRPAV